jgi:hypothetical protein
VGISGESNSAAKEIFFELTNLKMAAAIIPLGLVLFALLIYFTVIEPLLFFRVAPTVAIETLYRRMYRSGRSLAGESTRAETAHEFMNKLIRTFQNVNAEPRGSSHAFPGDVKDLTRIYQTSLFSNHVPERRDVKMALTIWKRLRWTLIVERVRYFFWMRNKAWR